MANQNGRIVVQDLEFPEDFPAGRYTLQVTSASQVIGSFDTLLLDFMVYAPGGIELLRKGGAGKKKWKWMHQNLMMKMSLNQRLIAEKIVMISDSVVAAEWASRILRVRFTGVWQVSISCPTMKLIGYLLVHHAGELKMLDQSLSTLNSSIT